MSSRPATDAVIPGIAALSVGHPGSAEPEGWQWSKLTNIARLESGHTPSRKHPEYWGGNVPWVSLPDARRHHGRIILDTTQQINALGLANSAARLLPANTVCLSRTASVGYVFRLGRPMATSQDFVNWVCSAALDPAFLIYALMAEGEHILNFGKGTTHTTIYFPEVLAFHLCLPPIAEQRRIVEKVEALLARVNAARDRLAKVPGILKRFRQSVLAAACSGELTATAHGDSAGGSDELPNGWRTMRAVDACLLVQNGNTPRNKPFTSNGDVPFLKIFNIVDQRITFECRRQFISKTIHLGELRRSITLPGDVLMNIVGPPLGKVAIVPQTYPEWNINQALVAFRPGPELCFFTTCFVKAPKCEGSKTSTADRPVK